MGTGDEIAADEGKALFEARLKEIIRKKREELEKEAKEIKPTDNFQEDMGFDSVDLFDLEIKIEEALGYVVDIDWININTFRDLVDHLEKDKKS